jgi:hypothetical protein
MLICRPTQGTETRTVRIGTSGEICGHCNRWVPEQSQATLLLKTSQPLCYMGFLTLMLRNKVTEELSTLKHYLSALE